MLQWWWHCTSHTDYAAAAAYSDGWLYNCVIYYPSYCVSLRLIYCSTAGVLQGVTNHDYCSSWHTFLCAQNFDYGFVCLHYFHYLATHSDTIFNGTRFSQVMHLCELLTKFPTYSGSENNLRLSSIKIIVLYVLTLQQDLLQRLMCCSECSSVS